jgi:hypothetical protein
MMPEIAYVRLERNWIDTESGRTALGPGMAVATEIHTGHGRIIDHLLSHFRKRSPKACTNANWVSDKQRIKMSSIAHRTLKAFRQSALLMTCAYYFQVVPIAAALPQGNNSSVGTTKMTGNAYSEQLAKEFRQALDARVKLETNRRPLRPFIHIDDLIAQFVRPGMTMHDAEALMKMAGLRVSTIDLKKHNPVILFLLDYPQPPIAQSIAVISLYPDGGNGEPRVAKAAAQINTVTL